MSTKELLEIEIYPALYSQIDRALPEFEFKRTAGGYISTTGLKLTGETGKAGKVYIYENNISHLIDHSNSMSKSLWDYIQERYRLTSNKEVLYKLAELSGVKLPNTDFDTEAYSKAKRQAQIWEDVNSYLMNSLETSKDKQAEDLRKYLKKRAYSPEDVRAMELGYIHSQAKLRAHLKSKGYSPEEIGSIQLTEAIGNTHTLTIPLREPVGDIIGLTVRNVKYKDTDKVGKYLNSTGLTKTDKLFNLRAIRGKKDLIIVEGLLDCLLASAKGIDNVVSLGGKGFNKAQLDTAIKHGAQKITLCYDNEEATIPNILKAIELIKNNSDLKIYVAQLPESIKDPDELISKQGAEAFKKVINEAIGYTEYELYNIISQYAKLQDETGELSAKDKDEFLQEIVTTASTIQEPIEKEMFTKTFLNIEEIKELGISKASLDETIEKIKYKKDKFIQEAKLKALLDEAKELQDKGDIEGALELLPDKLREIRAISKTTPFESLLIPVTESELRERLQEKPSSLSSGYNTDEGEELLLPAGALSIFSAPTSHGKTTMLLNLALNTAEKYPEKEFHIFSYEEDRDSVILKALNIYTNERLSKNNLKTLKSYYSEPENEKYTYFNRSGDEAKFKAFEPKREKFFSELIDSRRLNIHYVDYTSDTLLEAIEYLNNKTKVGAVYIDYMQLLRKGNKTKYNRRDEELKDICLGIKDTAVNTGLPIILGAQFNRQVVNHLGIHPTNIGEAGDIERIANTIIGFWNNNFKPLDLKPKTIKDEFLKDNTFYCKVLKMREGKVGSEFLLNFTGNTGKIENDNTSKGF